MQEFINALEVEFSSQANTAIAQKQKAYMRNKFEFYGLTATVRRSIQKPFLAKKYLPPKSELNDIVKTLWTKEQREFHHFAQELAYKYTKETEVQDIELFEYMVTHQSWWDTVDFIATKSISHYFKTYPEQIEPYIQKWLASNNIWLQRSALLFQLKWKEEIDNELMADTINYLLGADEFFINKAIGWVLREYSRTNPQWVIDFVDKTNLNSLSRREALRLLK